MEAVNYVCLRVNHRVSHANTKADEDDGVENISHEKQHWQESEIVACISANKPNGATADGGENSSSQVCVAVTEDIDLSWFAVAKSGVACVLCTVRGFQLRCADSADGRVTKATDATRVVRAPACNQCGLFRDWQTPDTRTHRLPDRRLYDEELVRAARMVALWEQMKLIGALPGGFSTTQMAAACMWLETGTDIELGDSSTCC